MAETISVREGEGFDLAAVERGRARPAESVLSPGTTLVPAPERRGLFGLFS